MELNTTDMPHTFEVFVEEITPNSIHVSNVVRCRVSGPNQHQSSQNKRQRNNNASYTE